MILKYKRVRRSHLRSKGIGDLLFDEGIRMLQDVLTCAPNACDHGVV